MAAFIEKVGKRRDESDANKRTGLPVINMEEAEDGAWPTVIAAFLIAFRLYVILILGGKCIDGHLLLHAKSPSFWCSGI